jgi:hypothetical protein
MVMVESFLMREGGYLRDGFKKKQSGSGQAQVRRQYD